ncbi:MAG: hypothetical protein J6S23_05395 [Clostridia bacterium]|nr:hypothetical protein [Clostridia bacterium]
MNKNIFDKAYERMVERYGENLDLRILNRFYEEKMILEKCELYTRYLDAAAKLRKAAESQGEHISLMGTCNSLFIAYLLGATDINPLPLHEYCPKCKRVIFTGQFSTAFDNYYPTCNCGENMEIDGFDLPFEADFSNAFRNRIRIGVSYSFFNEAEKMILDEMSDIPNIKFELEDEISSISLCFTDDDFEGTDYDFNKNTRFFRNRPHIILVPLEYLDKCRKLEIATGITMDEARRTNTLEVLLSFMNGDVKNIPGIEPEMFSMLRDKTNPLSYNEILKLIGITNTPSVWKDNIEKLFCKHKTTIKDVPVFKEDVYEKIVEKLHKRGIYKTGLAYDIMRKASGGYYFNHGLEESDVLMLLNLGFAMDFISFLENTKIMGSKSCAIHNLKSAIAMMFYKLRFEKEFNEIMLGNTVV